MTSVRSALAALVCAGVTVAAHGAAGGVLTVAGLVVLLLIAAIAGHHAVAAIRAGCWSLLSLVLLAGQFAGHAALHLVSHHHEAGAGPQLLSPAMLAAHVIATLACAGLMMWADHLAGVASATMRILIAVLIGAPAVPRTSLVPHWVQPSGCALIFLRSSVSLRGPPLSA
ncbi:hypothetical protein ONR57_15665 [Hoyosella sp. YIM 151337]|uniref:hypothetical protein n=1 Tax=Hoyosella sp. YIM 151337 TaxID=2992742 RepID=UPI0022367DD7|nr:hypothetical protein [Hoyosella sp. YIM 151337]MCW4354746.1 hypothetical protein [Hoyosella sp. YIM 151337]